jgi:prophage tail gpP-like protein
MSTPDTKFELILQDGRVYKTGPGGSVTDWWVDSDYFTSTDGWTCSFQSNDTADRSRLGMAPVEIKVDGRTQLIGRIDGVAKGKSGHLVSLRGRDYLADAIECGIDPLVHIKPGDKLEQALLQAMAPVGITALEDPEVKMERRTGAKPKKLPKIVAADMHLTKPEPGDSIYQFVNKIAARHGYTLQPATLRSKVCLEVPNYLQSAMGTIVRRDDGVGGLVIDAESDSDYSSFPTFAMLLGGSGKPTEQLGRTKHGLELWEMVGETVERTISEFEHCVAGGRRTAKSPALKDGELYRLLYFRDKDAKTQSQLVEAVWRAACEQLKKTLSYTVTLKGTCDPKTGLTYNVNTMVNVDDDIADVHEPLWVSSRGFGVKGSGGIVTQLKCQRPWSFVLGMGGHGTGDMTATRIEVKSAIQAAFEAYDKAVQGITKPNTGFTKTNSLGRA